MRWLKKPLLLSIILCFVFFLAYSVLSITKYNHFDSGYDLGIAGQAVWKYSKFYSPITTIESNAFISLLTDHVEIIYLILSPSYWIWNDPKMLLLLQAFFISFSGIPIFLLAKEKRLNIYLCYSILISYLAFYGIQNAIWADVHSVVFGASFLAWLIYFLETKKNKLAIIVFILALLSKENMAGITFLISLIYFITSRRKIGFYMTLISLCYLSFIFSIHFPYFTSDGYRYRSNETFLSNFNLYHFVDSNLKKNVLFTSFAWLGFLPFLSPLMLIPALGDLYSYFVLADHIKSGHELVGHYRVALAPLIIWPTIIAISKYKWLNKKWLALYILFWALMLQYSLHLPLSYLSKQWFWQQPQAVPSINTVISYLPKNASVVSQNNITPHIASREEVFTLWPKKTSPKENSFCHQKQCDWFHWSGKPEYLIADTSSNWNLTHLLTTREEFISGITNMEKAGYLKNTNKKATPLFIL